MEAKDIRVGDDCRARIGAGVNCLADVVALTLGPKGRLRAAAHQGRRDGGQGNRAEGTGLGGIDVRLDEVASDVQEQKAHRWENRADLDHVEKIAARESIRIAATSGEAVQAQRRRLLRLLRSPYFGRLDFARAGDSVAEPIYIGIHHFSDAESGSNLIHDWRAPISTLFYDHETGPAR